MSKISVYSIMTLVKGVNMRRILGSIDLGSSHIKLVVAEIINNKPKVLCAVSEPARGIKNGLIMNAEDTVFSLKKVFKKAEEHLGIKINKVIANIPSINLEIIKGEGTNTITGEDSIITGNDIIRILQTSCYNKIPDNLELINVIPITYKVDKTTTNDPRGMQGKHLSVKSLILTTPKKNVYSVVKCIEKCNVKVIDIMLGSLGDYYTVKNKLTDSSTGIIVNLGKDKTTISAFTKGILFKEKIIDAGGTNIDNDISFIYKVKQEDSIMLKENLALATKQKANPKETENIINKLGEKIEINQFELSEICSSRLTEILNLVKKEINYLTKKEISYIIFTGGLSEFKDFNLEIENIFNEKASVDELKIIGIRNNSYSTAIGMIKYFNEKLNLRDREYSIFNEEETDIIGSSGTKVNISNDSIIGKVFGYFFDN